MKEKLAKLYAMQRQRPWEREAERGLLKVPCVRLSDPTSSFLYNLGARVHKTTRACARIVVCLRATRLRSRDMIDGDIFFNIIKSDTPDTGNTGPQQHTPRPPPAHTPKGGTVMCDAKESAPARTMHTHIILVHSSKCRAMCIYCAHTQQRTHIALAFSQRLG